MKIPLHAVFAFFLLIFANYLARLSPPPKSNMCKSLLAVMN
jgi:hypothetical protein